MVEPKVVPHNPPHWDSHATFYESDHGITTSPACLRSNYSPSLQYLRLTLGKILYWALKLAIPSSNSTRHLNLPILSLSKRFRKTLKGNERRTTVEEWKCRKERKICEKTSCRDFWILTELGDLTSDSLLKVVEVRVSKRYLKVQCMCARV